MYLNDKSARLMTLCKQAFRFRVRIMVIIRVKVSDRIWVSQHLLITFTKFVYKITMRQFHRWKL